MCPCADPPLAPTRRHTHRVMASPQDAPLALTVDDLPDNALALVLSHLPTADKCRALGAARRWREVGLGNKLLWVDGYIAGHIAGL